MGFSNTNTKQKNTYIGESAGKSPILDLAGQMQQFMNQKKAQQNLLFGGEGYGGSFQSQDQRNWKPTIPDPTSINGAPIPNPSPYPNAKPYGGWGGRQGGAPGFGSDNPVMNPGAGGNYPTWQPKAPVEDSQMSQQFMAQKATMPTADRDQSSLQMPTPPGLTMNREVTSAASTNKGMPNVMMAEAQPGTAAYEARQQTLRQNQLGGPSGGDYAAATQPFTYEGRANDIRNYIGKKGAGAYGEGHEQALLDRLASPYTAADPGIEEALRARFDPQYAGNYANKTLVRNTGGAPRDVGQSAGLGNEYIWVDKSELDPAKWRKQRGV
jgi:hypothetical protein